MPNLPERYQSQVAAQANRRIIETPQTQADTSIGDALQHVGEVALEIQTRIQKSQQDKEILKAERETKTRLDKLKYDLEAEVGTPTAALPDRYRQESELIIKEGAAGITSETARNLWTERAKGWQGEGENWSVGLQRKRSVEESQAWHITTASDLAKQAGDLTISPEVFAKNIGDAKVAIQRDLESRMLSPEAAARQEAMLDTVAEKDATARWSAGVLATARGGDFEGAAKMVAAAPGIDEAVKEDALNTIQRERAKQEKERAETWNVNDANFQIEVMQGNGKFGLKSIDDRIASGELDPARRDTLYRVVREEQDRVKREALAAVTMSTAEKEAHRSQSADALGSFKALALYDPETFMQPDKWQAEDQEAFYAMTADDQRTIRFMVQGMPIKGGTTEEKTAVFNGLMAEAKRWAPPSWKLDTTKDGVRSWPRRALDSLLLKEAETLAPKLGGNALQQKQAQDIVGRVLGQIDPKADWSTIPSVAYNKAVSELLVDPSWSKPMPVVDDRYPDHSKDIPSLAGTPEYTQAYAELKARLGGAEPSSAAVQELLAARQSKKK